MTTHLAPSDSLPLAAPDWDRVGRLEWRQPRVLARRWELIADGELVAVLAARGYFLRSFVAQTARARWEVVLDWRGSAIVRREGESSPVLRFLRGWLGGKITGAEAEYRWKRGGWWRVLENREGFEFFRIRRRFSPPRAQASVELTDSGRRLGDLEPLLMLGWALMLAAHHRHGG